MRFCSVQMKMKQELHFFVSKHLEVEEVQVAAAVVEPFLSMKVILNRRKTETGRSNISRAFFSAPPALFSDTLYESVLKMYHEQTVSFFRTICKIAKKMFLFLKFYTKGMKKFRDFCVLSFLHFFQTFVVVSRIFAR